MNEHKHVSCRILYSTQSGRAKACARRTGRIIGDVINHYKQTQQQQQNILLQNGHGTTFDDALIIASTSSIQEYVQYLKQSGTNLLLCFVSTTGDGEHTDTIRQFWKQLLQKSLPNYLFQDISIAIFCLGDRCYGPDKFCAAGRKLMIRLRQLGATLYVNPGYGDDNTNNGGVFIDLDEWLYHTLLPKMLIGSMKLTESEDVKSIVNAIVKKSSNVTVTTNESSKKSLYDVKIVSKTKENANNPSIVEWQQPQYYESYMNFFQRQGPSSAYHYYTLIDNGNNVRQLIRSTNSNAKSSLLLGRMVENRRLTSIEWEQNTRHIRLDISNTLDNNIHSNIHGDDDNQPEVVYDYNISTDWSLDKLPYQAGDIAAILPPNKAQEVNAFIKVLPVHLQHMADFELSCNYNSNNDDTVLLQGIGYMFWPTKFTLRGFLTYCADIHTLPEREDLRALASYCSSGLNGKLQREKLISLSETEGSSLYVDYIIREKRSWVDVLYDFDSLRDDGSQLTVESILSLLQPIRPRLFSIASSPTKDWISKRHKESRQDVFSIELCVAAVEGKTRLGRTFHGLCSRYLCDLTPSTSEPSTNPVFLWIQPGSFHGLPLDCHNLMKTSNEIVPPVLCIGAGTGIAPLRALIHEREAVRSFNSKALPLKSPQSLINITQCTLVFGCRKKDADFYYEDEWADLTQDGRMRLLTAFSQDQWHKIYVQQVLASEKFGHDKIINHIFHSKGAIYVAGGPKMARAVTDVLVEAICKHMNNSDEKGARKILSKLQSVGLFRVEAWS